MTTTRASLSDDEAAVPETDPSDTASLLLERLRAYKHACGYLENYVIATGKLHKEAAKEYGKVLKSVSDPLREGHHFDQNLGGVAGLFENVRSNTQGVANSHTELETSLKGNVLPILDRLHAEIKNKSKELDKGASKSSKAVSKSRNATAKQIELLGQHTAAFSSAGSGVGKTDPTTDPYIIKRTVRHHLHHQILEENANRTDLIAVQDSFAAFEAHIVEVFQQALSTLYQYLGAQLDQERNMFGNVTATAQQVPGDFEWKGFTERYSNVLIDPNAPQRDMAAVSFPNQDHAATEPIMAGTLQRKSRVALKGYDSGFYVLTRSKFLHQLKSDDDDLQHSPSPELSLYLPDCAISDAADGEKFNIKGKDVSGGKVGTAMKMSSELSFKAHTPADAAKWFDLIREARGGSSSGTLTSPITKGDDAGAGAAAAAGDTTHKEVAPAGNPPGYTPTATTAAGTGAGPGTAPALDTAATGGAVQQPTGHHGSPIGTSSVGGSAAGAGAGAAAADAGAAGTGGALPIRQSSLQAEHQNGTTDRL